MPAAVRYSTWSSTAAGRPRPVSSARQRSAVRNGRSLPRRRCWCGRPRSSRSSPPGCAAAASQRCRNARCPARGGLAEGVASRRAGTRAAQGCQAQTPGASRRPGRARGAGAARMGRARKTLLLRRRIPVRAPSSRPSIGSARRSRPRATGRRCLGCTGESPGRLPGLGGIARKVVRPRRQGTGDGDVEPGPAGAGARSSDDATFLPPADLAGQVTGGYAEGSRRLPGLPL